MQSQKSLKQLNCLETKRDLNCLDPSKDWQMMEHQINSEGDLFEFWVNKYQRVQLGMYNSIFAELKSIQRKMPKFEFEVN